MRFTFFICAFKFALLRKPIYWSQLGMNVRREQMKKLTFGILIVTSLTLLSCRPEQLASDYNEFTLQEASGGGEEFQCATIDNLTSCEEAPLCQPLFEPEGTSEQDFITCIDLPNDEEDEPLSEEEEETPIDDDSLGDDSDSSSDDDSISDDDSSCDEDYSCGEGKVMVCHVPAGNSANAHTICIAEQGYLNGHASHEEDHLGPCTLTDTMGE